MNRKQLVIPLIQLLEDKSYHMGALSIVTRMYFTKVVKEAIIRGLKKGIPGLDESEYTELSNHILNELGKDSEELVNIIREFFVKGNE